MDSSRLIDLFKDGNMVIPLYFLKNYKKWNLSLEEFVFLMYLYNLGNHFLFNPSQYSDDLGVDLKTIMTYIDVLTNKGFIRVDVLEGEKGIKEEMIFLDDFYQKVTLLAMENVIQEKSDMDSDIFSVIEKEFGRTLSPIEYEIIKAWLDNHIEEEVIREAVKEATFNGVSNLRYIDKILYEWGKAGVHSVQDVENMRKKHKKQDEKTKNDDIDMDIVDWNWFDGDE